MNVEELYLLFAQNKIDVLERVFLENKAILASMLSGHFLRVRDFEKAQKYLPYIQNNEEKRLKIATLSFLKRLAKNKYEGQKPRVHILLLTYNRVGFVQNALEQLAKTAYPNYAVYILDNHSEDGTWEIVQKAPTLFPGTTHISQSTFNLGRPVGHNMLLTQYDHSLADFIAIADDDLLEIPEDWLSTMVSTALAFPKACVVGGKALYGGKYKIIHGVGRRLTQFSESRYSLTSGENKIDFGQYDYLDKTDHVIGCLHLYRSKPLFSDLGLFDIRYSPCQYVDLDHHLRARLLGYEIIYNGLIEFRHARDMYVQSKNNRAVAGNAIGNATKMIYKFDVSTMQNFIQISQKEHEDWVRSGVK